MDDNNHYTFQQYIPFHKLTMESILPYLDTFSTVYFKDFKKCVESEDFNPNSEHSIEALYRLIPGRPTFSYRDDTHNNVSPTRIEALKLLIANGVRLDVLPRYCIKHKHILDVAIENEVPLEYIKVIHNSSRDYFKRNTHGVVFLDNILMNLETTLDVVLFTMGREHTASLSVDYYMELFEWAMQNCSHYYKPGEIDMDYIFEEDSWDTPEQLQIRQEIELRINDIVSRVCKERSFDRRKNLISSRISMRTHSGRKDVVHRYPLYTSKLLPVH